MNPDGSKDLSIVLGCYNAAHQIRENVLNLVRFLETLNRSYEIIVVDDGSTDTSLAVLERIATRFPDLVVFHNPQNMGKGFAVRRGVLQARGKWIVFTDIDMAYSQRNLRVVLDNLEDGWPVVVGNRRDPDSIYTAKNTLVRYV